MEYLRSKEKEKLEKSGKTLKQVWEQVESYQKYNQAIIKNTEIMVEAICCGMGGKEKLLANLESRK